MADSSTVHPDVALNLALAVVSSSAAPLLLVDGDLTVIAASASFGQVFGCDLADVRGRTVFALGAGEWNSPQLRVLLNATAAGYAEIDAYEMDLVTAAARPRRLVINARKLDYGAEDTRMLVTVSDVTEVRLSEKLKDDLLREKAVLLQEVQHRVANSLQIIASVILQSARKTQSEDARSHLNDAHNRVMSVAALQRQLSASRLGDIELRAYFGKLCESIGASMIRDHNQLKLEVEADSSMVAADISISLGLIVTELVINSLKHAFPGGRTGRIVVGYKATGSDWTLSVTDNGVGMPTDAASAKAGLGTNIVEALAKQLDADVRVRSADPGAEISIIHTASDTLGGRSAGSAPPAV